MNFSDKEIQVIVIAVDRYQDNLCKLMTKLPYYARKGFQDTIDTCEAILTKCEETDE